MAPTPKSGSTTVGSPCSDSSIKRRWYWLSSERPGTASILRWKSAASRFFLATARRAFCSRLASSSYCCCTARLRSSSMCSTPLPLSCSMRAVRLSISDWHEALNSSCCCRRPSWSRRRCRSLAMMGLLLSSPSSSSSRAISVASLSCGRARGGEMNGGFSLQVLGERG